MNGTQFFARIKYTKSLPELLTLLYEISVKGPKDAFGVVEADIKKLLENKESFSEEEIVLFRKMFPKEAEKVFA